MIEIVLIFVVYLLGDVIKLGGVVWELFLGIESVDLEIFDGRFVF